MKISKSIIALINLACLTTAGCGGGGPEFAEVTGTVRVKGKPMAGLRVSFHPDTELKQFGPTSEGVTDDQGKYTLRCEIPSRKLNETGAVIGSHRVTITDNDPPATPQGEIPPPDKVEIGYRSVASTPLRAEVKPGSQTIDFDIE